jgi:hypothetical protein
METVLMTHPENVMPFCIRHFEVLDESGTVVYRKEDNHQTRCTIVFDDAVHTNSLTLRMQHPADNIPAALFQIRCYNQ